MLAAKVMFVFNTAEIANAANSNFFIGPPFEFSEPVTGLSTQASPCEKQVVCPTTDLILRFGIFFANRQKSEFLLGKKCESGENRINKKNRDPGSEAGISMF